MAFGRRNRPSLVGTAARTAVVVGTATAASNAVNASAANKQAAAQQAAEQQQLAQQAQMLPVPVPAPAVAPAPAAPAVEDLLSKLERLAALHASGALSDEEFAAVKASIIG
ncbi:SHOCT domain-containing protein [Arthrobacter sp.]|uniref:SHOCT domain-containing protein n=1 Tax=Arthrobacter sp. TaxID=1667 RepID=UPI0026DEA256|nr:SHOCT domain-containing protein [Arthrobacter sp.]MDO5752743.1 SHOCT domain-containing protein [Arthrobacter sp.]